MSAEENKAIVRRFTEACSRGDLAAAMEMIGPDYLDTDAPPGTPRGPEGWMQTHRMFFDAFPDLRITIEDSVAEGDKVASRWTATGTHAGEMAGMPPTGRRIAITGMSLGRISGGRFVENLDIVNRLGLMQQIGAIPSPEETGTR